MQMIKILIVDDEQASVDTHKQLLEDFFPNIRVVGDAQNVSSAIECIANLQPDIVLLDIELDDGSGFDVLKAFPHPNFKTIFITAFDQFAVQAFRLSAVDYLLKPVNPLEFREAIEKALQNVVGQTKQIELLTLLHNLSSDSKYEKKIVVKTADDIHLIKTESLTRIESDGAYCHLYLHCGKRITVSHNIKHYEEILLEYGFIRCHQSHMVNLKYIDRFQKSDGGMLILTTGQEVPVSSRKREAVIAIISKQGLQ